MKPILSLAKHIWYGCDPSPGLNLFFSIITVRPAVRYFFFVSATQSATSATFKLQLIHLII